MKHLNVILAFLVVLIFTFILYSERRIFSYKYEPEYYENLYYHSQWNYPSSTRGISDGELYKFVGFRLAEGENPFNINFEMPPLGKYLYGLAEKYFGNPYWVSILFYVFSALFLFYLSKEIFIDKGLSLLSVLLFVTTPFVSSQIGETMLDLPHMFFYLAHAFYFVKFLSGKRRLPLIVSGIFLGLATGTKPGIYTPFVILLESVIFFLPRKDKKIIDYLWYLIFIFAGYVLAFFCYFIKHPNPIPWVRLHQKQLSFYFEPVKTIRYHDYFLVWKNIFLNSYQGWWWADRRTIGGASLILPVGAILLLPVILLSIRKKEFRILYLSSLIMVFLLVDHFVFFPRYLMTIIPFFIIITVFFFKKYKYILLLLSFLSLPFLISYFSANNPVGDFEAVGRFFSTRAYRELYRSILPTERLKISEKQFIDLNEYFLESLGTRAVDISLISFSKTSMSAKAKYKVNYETKYGVLSHQSEITFLKVNNQWRQVWNWDLLWPGYSPSVKITVKEGTIPIKRIETSDGKILAERERWKMVYIFPRVMFDWGKSLNNLSEVIGEDSRIIDNRIRRVVPDHFVRFAGYLDPALGKEGIDKANLISGVTLKDVDYLIVRRKGDKGISETIRQIQENKPGLFCMKTEVFLEGNDGKKSILPLQCSEEKNVVIKI